MHKPGEVDIEATLWVFKCLKSSIEKGTLFSKNDHLNIVGYTDETKLGIWSIENLLQDTLPLLVWF